MKSIPPASQASFCPGLATRWGTAGAIVLLLVAGCMKNDTQGGGSGGVGSVTTGAVVVTALEPAAGAAAE